MSDERKILGDFWKDQDPTVRPEKRLPRVDHVPVNEEPHTIKHVELPTAPPQAAPRITYEALPEPSDDLRDANARTAPVVQDFAATITRGTAEEMGITLDDLLVTMLDQKGSDLHLAAGLHPMMRLRGDLEPMLQYPVLSSGNIKTLMYGVMSEERQKEFEQTKELDMAHSIPGRSRFRVNVFHQRHNIGTVIRGIPNKILSLEELGMPEVVNDFAKLPRGLVLVTGPTGSGKSTTLAGIIDLINRTRKDHIMTIEDPIEFVHESIKCVVNQREVGVDTFSFGEALKRALREDPDVILLGEMRDYETISTAITAAETGHLVFGTLHTQSAAETMDRIIDAFPDGSKNQVRAQLAATLQGIISQTLIKTLDGKSRIAAVEILRGEPSVRALVRNGKSEQIRSALETGRQKGMQTLDMHLKELVMANRVAVDEAIERSSSPDSFIASLNGADAVNTIRRRQNELGASGQTRAAGVSLGVR